MIGQHILFGTNRETKRIVSRKTVLKNTESSLGILNVSVGSFSECIITWKWENVEFRNVLAWWTGVMRAYTVSMEAWTTKRLSSRQERWQIKTESESKQDKSDNPLESKSFFENCFLTVRKLTKIYPENTLFPQAEAVADIYPVQD